MAGVVAMTDETADMCFVGFHRDRDLAVTDDISSATGGIAAGNKTGAVVIPLDFARDTQILDGIIPGKAEGCYIVKRIPKIVVQRMAVTIEMSWNARYCVGPMRYFALMSA